jgi:hypothetical protein
VIKSALSSAVCTTAEDLLSSRDLYRIWQGLQRLCGPRSSNTGLSALEVQWSTTNIKAGEAMPDFLQRMDKMARSFSAYGPTYAKNEQYCAILVREALKTSKHWEKLEAEIHWSSMRSRSWFSTSPPTWVGRRPLSSRRWSTAACNLGPLLLSRISLGSCDLWRIRAGRR